MDRQIAVLAARQHGVVAATQLAALGVRQRALSHRVAAGRLHRVHHGVYAVGHRVLGRHGHWMAAVLACGPEAALSHAAAGALWEIRASAATLTDVAVPRPGARKRPGLRIHRPRSIPHDEVTTRDGIPVTTPARAVLDLAATLPRDGLERALDQVELQELTDYPALDALARAHTRAAEERRSCAARCRATKPAPTSREASSSAASSGSASSTACRSPASTTTASASRRDQALAEAGYRTVRFTPRQVEAEPGSVARTLERILRTPA